ncbi:MAG TPA: SWIM zinc finger family protein [Aggregatilineales bacterium]|nr:SWIM zinc finger family protein [Aggregatilineales bacterium]
MRPNRIKALQAKGKRLSARIIRHTHNSYVVLVGSSSTATLNFIVSVDFHNNGQISARCTCKWAEHGGIACSHVLAALTKLASTKQRALSFWLTPEEAKRQRQSVFSLRLGKDNVYITSRPAPEPRVRAA